MFATLLLSRREQESSPAPPSLLRWTVAVAQTPGHLTGAFLRVGSEKPRLVSPTQRRWPGVVALSSFSGRHSERSPGFRERLYATASTTSTRPWSGVRDLASSWRRSSLGSARLDSADSPQIMS